MPSRLTHWTETMSFGWYLAVVPVSEPGVVIGCPLTAVITSPGTMPATLAAESQMTLTMSAPAAVGATFAGTSACGPAVWQGMPFRRAPPPRAASAACSCGLSLLLSATDTPRKPGTPMYTVAVGLPAAICRAMDRALLMGMAKPRVPPEPEPVPAPRGPPVLAAVIMPMTWPALLARAPPESPCWIRALVCSMCLRFSVVLDPSSLAWIERSSALMMPTAGLAPPRPSALPRASTGVPRLTCEELPKLSTGSPEAPTSWSRATSSVAS